MVQGSGQSISFRGGRIPGEREKSKGKGESRGERKVKGVGGRSPGEKERSPGGDKVKEEREREVQGGEKVKEEKERKGKANGGGVQGGTQSPPGAPAGMYYTG